MSKHIQTFAMGILGLTTMSGCVANTEEEPGNEPSTGVAESALENGTLTPSKNSDGVALLYIWTTSGTWGKCTGQLIARNAFLTAGHCFYNSGHTSTSQTVYIDAYHQHSNGTWENLTASGGNTYRAFTVSMKQDFIDIKDGGNFAPGEDVAVARSSSDLINVTSSDAAAIHRSSTREMSGGWAYGHGYHTDSSYDGQLRVGYMHNPDYSGKVITVDYGESDAHTCFGDSGGPLKLGTEMSVNDGILYGVIALDNGTGNCKENWAQFTNVGFHDTWIKSKLASGACTNKTYTQGGVETILCW
jgi:V8-like Glu-specific endopeptidase